MYTVHEFARALGVPVPTVNGWIKTKKLLPWHRGERGRGKASLYSQRDLERFEEYLQMKKQICSLYSK